MFTDPKEFAFDEHQAHFSSPFYKTEISWAAFGKLTEDEGFFYLHSTSLGSMVMLPKRIFDDANREKFIKCSQSVPRV